MSDEHNGTVRHALDVGEHVTLGPLVQGARRFIKQKQGMPCIYRARDGKSLHLTFREPTPVLAKLRIEAAWKLRNKALCIGCR